MNIDSLLRQRESRRISDSGDSFHAKARFPLTQFISKNFKEFNKLRLHLFHDHRLKVSDSSKLKELIDTLSSNRFLIKGKGDSVRLPDDEKNKFYLAGGWLEELLYFAHIEAGVDEIYFGQKIKWSVNGVEGKNEIDVLARRGEVLSFTSCKAISEKKTNSHLSKMRHFLTETDYWNIHFANDKGRALLMVTADLIDEANNFKKRYPSLHARATVLDVSVAGLERLEWNKLVSTVDNHWK